MKIQDYDQSLRCGGTFAENYAQPSKLQDQVPAAFRTSYHPEGPKIETLNKAMEVITTKIIQIRSSVEEKAVRDYLVGMGWTPPPETIQDVTA